MSTFQVVERRVMKTERWWASQPELNILHSDGTPSGAFGGVGGVLGGVGGVLGGVGGEDLGPRGPGESRRNWTYTQLEAHILSLEHRHFINLFTQRTVAGQQELDRRITQKHASAGPLEANCWSPCWSGIFNGGTRVRNNYRTCAGGQQVALRRSDFTFVDHDKLVQSCVVDLNWQDYQSELDRDTLLMDSANEAAFTSAKTNFAKLYWKKEMEVDADYTAPAVLRWRADQRNLYHATRGVAVTKADPRQRGGSAGPMITVTEQQFGVERAEFDAYKERVRGGAKSALKRTVAAGPRDIQSHTLPMLQVLQLPELTKGFDTSYRAVDEEDEFLLWTVQYKYWEEMIEDDSEIRQYQPKFSMQSAEEEEQAAAVAVSAPEATGETTEHGGQERSLVPHPASSSVDGEASQLSLANLSLADHSMIVDAEGGAGVGFGGGKSSDQVLASGTLSPAEEEDDSNFIVEPLRTLDLLQDNIDSRDDVDAVPTRYPLIRPSKGFASLLGLLKRLPNWTDIEVIVGSSFAGDSERDPAADVFEIQRYLEAGKKVLLVNSANTYESIYDALNQYYTIVEDRRYVQMGLGVEKPMCRVAKGARLILVDADAVNLPTPLLNRLEKYRLTARDLLQTEVERELASALEKWAKEWSQYRKIDFQKHVMLGGQTVSEKRGAVDSDFATFVGWDREETPAIIAAEVFAEYQFEGAVFPTGDSSDEELVKTLLPICQRRLLQTATPEAVLHYYLVDSNTSIEHSTRQEVAFQEYFQIRGEPTLPESGAVGAPSSRGAGGRALASIAEDRAEEHEVRQLVPEALLDGAFANEDKSSGPGEPAERAGSPADSAPTVFETAYRSLQGVLQIGFRKRPQVFVQMTTFSGVLTESHKQSLTDYDVTLLSLDQTQTQAELREAVDKFAHETIVRSSSSATLPASGVDKASGDHVGEEMPPASVAEDVVMMTPPTTSPASVDEDVVMSMSSAPPTNPPGSDDKPRVLLIQTVAAERLLKTVGNGAVDAASAAQRGSANGALKDKNQVDAYNRLIEASRWIVRTAVEEACAQSSAKMAVVFLVQLPGLSSEGVKTISELVSSAAVGWDSYHVDEPIPLVASERFLGLYKLSDLPIHVVVAKKTITNLLESFPTLGYSVVTRAVQDNLMPRGIHEDDASSLCEVHSAGPSSSSDFRIPGGPLTSANDHVYPPFETDETHNLAQDWMQLLNALLEPLLLAQWKRQESKLYCHLAAQAAQSDDVRFKPILAQKDWLHKAALSAFNGSIPLLKKLEQDFEDLVFKGAAETVVRKYLSWFRLLARGRRVPDEANFTDSLRWLMNFADTTMRTSQFGGSYSANKIYHYLGEEFTSAPKKEPAHFFPQLTYLAVSIWKRSVLVSEDLPIKEFFEQLDSSKERAEILKTAVTTAGLGDKKFGKTICERLGAVLPGGAGVAGAAGADQLDSCGLVDVLIALGEQYVAVVRDDREGAGGGALRHAGDEDHGRVTENAALLLPWVRRKVDMDAVVESLAGRAGRGSSDLTSEERTWLSVHITGPQKAQELLGKLLTVVDTERFATLLDTDLKWIIDDVLDEKDARSLKEGLAERKDKIAEAGRTSVVAFADPLTTAQSGFEGFLTTEIAEFLKDSAGPHHVLSDKYSQDEQETHALKRVSASVLAKDPLIVDVATQESAGTDVPTTEFVKNLQKWSQPHKRMSFEDLVVKTEIKDSLNARVETGRRKRGLTARGLFAGDLSSEDVLKGLWETRSSRGLRALLLEDEAGAARALVARLAVFLQEYELRKAGPAKNLLEQLADLATAEETHRQNSFLPAMAAPTDIQELRWVVEEGGGGDLCEIRRIIVGLSLAPA